MYFLPEVPALVCTVCNCIILTTTCAGKSFLLKRIIYELLLSKKKVAVTASTGIAACNINGTTLHSFAGVRENPDGTIDARSAWRNKENWKSIDVLIIDEISMIHAALFDGIEEVARAIRGYGQEQKYVFGKIQLVRVLASFTPC